MAAPKRSVLVTGCSDGGAGAALAAELHKKGLKVYATARSLLKMADLQAANPDITLLEMDITSPTSIATCVTKIPSLDILINNAGTSYVMPITDIDLSKAKEVFDTNVWGYIATIQAFMPLLLKSSNAVIVNHTSTGAGLCIPLQASYNASKAAIAMITDSLRLELQAFDVSVVELRTGGVKTNIANNIRAKQPSLPERSIYTPAKEVMEKALRTEWFDGMGVTPEQWAREVVGDLLKGKKPPPSIWRGESAWAAWAAGWVPGSWFAGMVKKMTGLAEVEGIIRRERERK